MTKCEQTKPPPQNASDTIFITASAYTTNIDGSDDGGGIGGGGGGGSGGGDVGTPPVGGGNVGQWDDIMNHSYLHIYNNTTTYHNVETFITE